MTNWPAQVNKTISLSDMQRPEVEAAARALKKFGHGLWMRRVPFAVNGVLKKRWRIRWNKLWEYSRGLAYGEFRPGMRILDFGGGGTIPVLYLGSLGCEVLSLDIDAGLTAHTNSVAKKTGWKIVGSTFDLTQQEPLSDWGTFDRIISFCVIEHIPKAIQTTALARLASVLKPGGLFELTFDFGDNAPVEGAVRSTEEAIGFARATKLSIVGDGSFHDTGERFALDRKYPGNEFTFGSLFLSQAGDKQAAARG
jgi:SAM-dependent methyltransferase